MKRERSHTEENGSVNIFGVKNIAKPETNKTKIIIYAKP
jgi:hypothetical protein